MTRLAEVPTASAHAEEIPDEIFATLPDHEGRSRIPETHDAADLGSLPDLPSLESLTAMLANVQAAIEAANVEANAIKAEVREKAEALRAMAAALETM